MMMIVCLSYANYHTTIKHSYPPHTTTTTTTTKHTVVVSLGVQRAGRRRALVDAERIVVGRRAGAHTPAAVLGSGVY
jgi:hypothetical protein